MRNLFKYLSVTAVAILLAAAFTACDDDDDWAPGETPSGPQVYFPSSASNDVEVSNSESSFTIPIARVNTDGSITVPLTVTGASTYTIPTSVTFSDGEAETEITGTYDPDDLEYDVYEEITITIDDSYTTPYADASCTFEVGMPAPWTSLGNATYTDDFMTTFYSVGNETYEVEIQENSMYPGYYRLVNPYGAAYPWNETYDDGTADWDTSQDWYFYIDAQDPDGVYIELQETGMDWGYGNIIMGSLAYYYMAVYGYTLDEMKSYGYTGTLADGIITFPSNTLLICMPDYNSGYYYANTNGAFMVAMPGVVIGDYSVEVEYVGQYTDSDDEPAGVIAEVTSMGDDVEYVRVAVVEGTSADEDDITAITEGTVSYSEVTTTGQVLVPWTETPSTGRYTLVAVSYGNDTAQEYAEVIFKYTEATAGEDPLDGEYSYLDIDYDLEPDSPDGYDGSYSLYAIDLFNGEDSRNLQSSSVTLAYDGVDSDGYYWVNISGLFPDYTAYYGFDDTFQLEFDDELYMYNKPKLGQGYYYWTLLATAEQDGKNYYYSSDGYCFTFFAPVYEGYLALMDLYAAYGYSYGFNGFTLFAYTDEDYSSAAGYVNWLTDVMLVENSADTQAASIASTRATELQTALLSTPRNAVETDKGFIKGVLDEYKAKWAAEDKAVATASKAKGTITLSDRKEIKDDVESRAASL